MTDAPFTDLDRFVTYADKQFELSLLAGCFADDRQEPEVPSRAVGLSLLLGEVAQVPSLLQLEEETKLPQWQRWVGYPERISHDTFGYTSPTWRIGGGVMAQVLGNQGNHWLGLHYNAGVGSAWALVILGGGCGGNCSLSRCRSRRTSASGWV